MSGLTVWKGFREESRDGGSQLQKIQVGSDVRVFTRSALQHTLAEPSQDNAPKPSSPSSLETTLTAILDRYSHAKKEDS